MGNGFISTVIPVVTIVVAILISYLSAIRFDVAQMMSAENLAWDSMASPSRRWGCSPPLGITLATDAYGPIADNAGAMPR